MRQRRSPQTLAIVGSGASGVLLALHLLRQRQQPFHIFLIDFNQLIGRGIAYGTTNVSHLLNVSAGKISAYADRPAHFVQWLMKKPGRMGDGVMPTETSFVPRYLYGEYLQATLEEAEAQNEECWCEYIADEVLALKPGEDDRVSLFLRSGRRISTQQVVLALGNIPPRDPSAVTSQFYTSKRYRAHPWSAAVFSAIQSHESVLFLGSGLTMIDHAVALNAQGHAGPLLSISRHGLLPFPHRPVPCPPLSFEQEGFPTTIRALFHWVRVRCQQEEQFHDWRCVLDALRPHTQMLWQSLPEEEQRRFLRHVQTVWDVRRHRIAPIIASSVENMREQGQLRVLAATLRSFEESDDGVVVTYKMRGAHRESTLFVHHVINCTGAGFDVTHAPHPLLANLFSQGLLRPDPLNLGVDAAEDGAVIARDGTPSSCIYVLGPLRKGRLWETTALPEIRQQALQLALTLVDQCQ